MAQYQVNLQISAGTDFLQVFTVSQPDSTPIDITGHKFNGVLAKHAGALDATAEETTYVNVPFDTRVVDGGKGQYSIGLTAEATSKLTEGKYVYNVILENSNGVKTQVVKGLVFVSGGFGQ